MAAQGSVEDSFTFVQGLVTEGGFFVHPKNAWKDGVNVVPNIDGSVERRQGVDYEDLYSLYAADIDASERDLWAFTVERWNTVGGNGNLDFFVVQLGPTVHFYESATGTISAQKKSFTVDLSSFLFTGFQGVVGTSQIKATVAYGKLIITCKDCDPILVIYDRELDTITTDRLELKIRDFSGIPSPKPVSYEGTQDEWIALQFWPHSLYNLFNQGWTIDTINGYRLAKGGSSDLVVGYLPSNSKQWIYGKNTNDDFDVKVLDKQDFGSMTAPRGRVIMDAFLQDRVIGLQNSLSPVEYARLPVGGFISSTPDIPNAFEYLFGKGA
jgi:hypothetical protein